MMDGTYKMVNILEEELVKVLMQYEAVKLAGTAPKCPAERRIGKWLDNKKKKGKEAKGGA